MTIDYKNPYWVKYEWGIETNLDSIISKKDNFDLLNVLFEDTCSFICDFKIDKNYKKDEKAGIFGKAGQNFGLNFDSKINSLVFEFRTNNSSPIFHCIIFKTIKFKDVTKGLKIFIIKNKNEFSFYVNDTLLETYKFEGELIDDYKDSPFFLGALNPGAKDEKDRCYSEIDFNLFCIVKNETNIDVLMDINNTNKNVMCYYDFKRINVNKNVCDESNHYNFIEMVPKEYIL